MPLVLEIYRWIIYGNIWMALGAVSLTYSSSIIMYDRVSIPILLIVFFATLIGYNYQTLISVRAFKNNSPKDEWFLANINLIKMIGYVSFICCIYLCVDNFSVKEMVLFLPFFLITLCYRWPILGVALRDIPYLKIFLIALTWGFVTVLLPQYSEHDLVLNWSLILNNSLYILGITIPFDIRDLETDSRSKKTIPQLFGVARALFIAVICISISGYLYYIEGYLALTLVCLFSVIIIMFSIKKRPDWYFSFIIDGLLLLFPLFTIFKS